MSAPEPVSKFVVQTNVSGSLPLTITAVMFSITTGGALVFCDANGRTVAAFAPSDWLNVMPVAST